MLYDSTATGTPTILIFNPESEMFYCYYGTEFALFGHFDDFEGFLNLEDVWYVSESQGGTRNVLANTFITLSPRQKNDEYLNFYEFRKKGLEQFSPVHASLEFPRDVKMQTDCLTDSVRICSIRTL